MYDSIANTLETTSTTVSEDPRWARVAARDRSADGQFWYSVLTTGVYCRPSCPARTALREYRRYFGSAGEAEAAGYRACLN